MKEGVDPPVSAMFYRLLVHAGLLLGVETWVFSEAMPRKFEDVHVGFLRKITGKKEVQQMDGTWRCVSA